jgi:hypothetical protein
MKLLKRTCVAQGRINNVNTASQALSSFVLLLFMKVISTCRCIAPKYGLIKLGVGMVILPVGVDIRWIFDLMGADAGVIFYLWVRPSLTP